MSATQTTRPARRTTDRSGSGGFWKSGNGPLWILQAVLAAGFVGAAVPKLGDDPFVLAQFADLGFGAAGMHTIGILEMAGAIGLLIPRLVGPAATALSALMVGAVTLTVVHLGFDDAIAPTAYLAVAAFVAWCRRDRTRRLASDAAAAVRRSR